MATSNWTISKVNTTFGHMRAVVMSCTATTDTEQNIETGLNNVIFHIKSTISGTTSNSQMIWANKLEAGTAAAGYLGCSGFTANDDFYIIAVGT